MDKSEKIITVVTKIFCVQLTKLHSVSAYIPEMGWATLFDYVKLGKFQVLSIETFNNIIQEYGNTNFTALLVHGQTNS